MEGRFFRATGYPWRLFCGERAIENNLPGAVRGAGASRALVICSPSINRQTDLVQRIKAALGSHYAGVFDGIENDSTYGSVQAATAVRFAPPRQPHPRRPESSTRARLSESESSLF